MSIIQERYVPVPMAANSTYTFPSGSPSGIAGFLCSVAGAMTVTNSQGQTVISAFPLTAGAYIAMPFYVGSGSVVVLSGGAAGTLGVS